MCLLIVMFRLVPGAPLLVAANRDEQADRPAVPMTVLQAGQPRILGGRDLLAGGTWLAVAEHGLVAGLTNRPTAAGRDPARRSRGELPLACARHDSAAAAVGALARQVDPRAYNPCWMLVGDRQALFAVSLAPGAEKPDIEELGPGLHVLENAPLQAHSAKAGLVRQMVTRALAGQPGEGPAAVASALGSVLRAHQPAVPWPREGPAGRMLAPALSAACVHADGYGTRSAMVVTVPAEGRPEVMVAAGAPCQAPLRDATSMWQVCA